jgi:hypothetical protein
MPLTEHKQSTANQLIMEQGISRENGHPERRIISLNGQPFYQSSGQNSGSRGTWFPFFGRLEKDQPCYYMKRGWFIKPSDYSFPNALSTKMKQLYPTYSGSSYDEQLLSRFGSLSCMLISSCIGGGLWNEESGIELKRYLQENYPEFYCIAPTLTLLPATQIFETPEEMNAWLCQKASLSNYEDLTKKMPQTIEDIHFHDGFDPIRSLPIYEQIKSSREALAFVTQLCKIDPEAFALIQQFTPATAANFSRIEASTFAKMCTLKRTEQRKAVLIGIAEIHGQKITHSATGFAAAYSRTGARCA